MIYTRSVKCYYNRWITRSKLEVIRELISEASSVVTFAISNHEKEILKGLQKKSLLLAANLSKCNNTWLTARAKKNAFAEAHALVLGTKNSSEVLDTKYTVPKHSGTRILLSCTNVRIQETLNLKNYDLLVELYSFDSRKKAFKVAIPLKKNRMFNKWKHRGKLCSSIILTDRYIQFSFEINTPKKIEGDLIGVDPNAKILLSDSDGNHYGYEIWDLLKKLRRKKRCSKSWYRCREEIKEYIDRTCVKLPYWGLKLLCLENNKKIKCRSKLRGRLSKNIRSFLIGWSINRINDRIERLCEENGVTLRRVPAFDNSIRCPSCNHCKKENRVSQEEFICQNCGFSDNANTVGAINSLARFSLGTYGSKFKADFINKHSDYCLTVS